VKHKRQHYVPKSYLQAWCDPNCPPGQTPYVWVFSKGGGRVRKKSPEKLFRETDMYTVRTDAEGNETSRSKPIFRALKGNTRSLERPN
jgi:hypothetical protein